MTEGYSKVTIIIESGDETTTYTIPKARNLVEETNAIEVREGVWPREFLTQSMGFSVGMIADFDEAKQHVMSILKTNVGKEVDRDG